MSSKDPNRDSFSDPRKADRRLKDDPDYPGPERRTGERRKADRRGDKREGFDREATSAPKPT